MPNFNEIQGLRNKRQLITPKINSFSVERNKSFVGYKSIINWDYKNDDIVGFRVWRCISQKVMLKKNYSISQAALERVSGIKQFQSKNSVLFNKQFFSQNSKVKFFESGSDRFSKRDETDNIESYSYFDIGFVKKNKEGKYSFTDRRIKFGETYFYVLSAIHNSGFESQKSSRCVVRIEDLVSPDSPEDIRLSLGSNFINIIIGTNVKAEDVKEFQIFKTDDDDKPFQKIATIPAAGNFVNFLDFNTIPGKTYFYKVYSVDLYDNISFSSSVNKLTCTAIGLDKKGDVPFPRLSIEIDSNNHVKLAGKLNHPDLCGYKFERCDSWKFDRNFEIKTFLGVSWPNAVFFDSSGSAELIDKSVTSGSFYQYRVSSIKKNGLIASYFITPHIKIEDGFKFSNDYLFDLQHPTTSLDNLNVRIVEQRQDPISAGLQWKISGPWDSMSVDVKNPDVDKKEPILTLFIDNIPDRNEIYFHDLKKGSGYIFKASVFHKGKIVASSNGPFNTPRIAI